MLDNKMHMVVAQVEEVYAYGDHLSAARLTRKIVMYTRNAHVKL